MRKRAGKEKEGKVGNGREGKEREKKGAVLWCRCLYSVARTPVAMQ